MGTLLASRLDVITLYFPSLSRGPRWPTAATVVSILFLSIAGLALPAAAEDPLAWPEDQQAFWFDGPAWLMTDAQQDALMGLSDGARERAIADFLRGGGQVDGASLQRAITRRRQLMLRDSLSTLDERSQLLFLHGAPTQRRVIDCAEAFRPMEIWQYGASEPLVLYQPKASEVFKLWLPLESKKVLYTQELEFWLEEWEIFGNRIRGKRIDKVLCPEAEVVDRVTGVDGLGKVLPEQPLSKDLIRWLARPTDLEGWVEKALMEPAPEAAAAPLPVPEIEAHFPKRTGLRMKTQLFVTLPPGTPLVPYIDGEHEELRVSVEGVVESEGKLFDRFRLRYVLDAPEEGVPILLAMERNLRPGKRVRIRIRLLDEVGESQSVATHTLLVPMEPDPLAAELAAVAMAPNEKLDRQLETGPDGLVLLVPPREVVFGSLRAQAVVRGNRIDRVTFGVDDQAQLTKRSEPWTVDLVVPNIPRELTVWAEAFDENGELVARDEAVMNQPRGELAVSVLEPARGARPRGSFVARARVVVPEGRRVERLEFQVNNKVVTSLVAPPWEASLTMPDTADLAYLTVVAHLDDDSRAEDVRFLNAPYEMSEVDVQLVELYTTVLGRGGGLVRDLSVDDFVVREDGREQSLEKFELVTDLPLTIGITMDTSGSMIASLGEAQRAAVEFLDRIVDPQDQCFAVGFSDEPSLIMPRTHDVGAVAETLEGLRADGWTALHDAVVFSLYYFSDVKGRRVLILLSDGDDTDSRLEYQHVLEYAKQSSVVIYTIGLKNDSLDGKARRKLAQLAQETGGRSFLIDQAEELSTVYQQIEEELRSQYLLAYNSDSTSPAGTYRLVEVETKKRGLKPRTIHGYYP